MIGGTYIPSSASGGYWHVETEHERLEKAKQLAAESLARVKKFKELSKMSFSQESVGVFEGSE